MARTSFTSVGNCADSPEPILRLLPIMGYAANILGVSDPYLGYDAGDFPHQRPQRKLRSTSHTAPFRRLCRNIPMDSIVRRAEDLLRDPGPTPAITPDP
jgi:hypothetical protein